MPKFLDTRGNTKIAIGICARCSIKFPYDELMPDPNSPGLYVCADDRDAYDPYRLPARESENITLEHPRPDVPIDTPGPTPIYANQIDGISNIGFARPWQVDTPYAKGASITPQNVNDQNVPLPQYWFLCTTAGRSGLSAPVWPVNAGVTLVDGTVEWVCLGIFPN